MQIKTTDGAIQIDGNEFIPKGTFKAWVDDKNNFNIVSLIVQTQLIVPTLFSSIEIDGQAFTDLELFKTKIGQSFFKSAAGGGGLTPEEKEKVDSLLTNGDGTKYLADDGTYKAVSGLTPEQEEKVDAIHLTGDANKYLSEDGTYKLVPPNEIGSVSPSDTEPMASGIYRAKIAGTYINLGGLIAKEGFMTWFNKSGASWTLYSEVEIIGGGGSDIPFTEITFNNWTSNNVITLNSNTNVNVVGIETSGFLLVRQDNIGGHNLSINGNAVTIPNASESSVVIGLINFGSNYYLSIGGELTKINKESDVAIFTEKMTDIVDYGSGILQFDLDRRTAVLDKPLSEIDEVIINMVGTNGQLVWGVDDNRILNLANEPTRNWKFFSIFNSAIYMVDSATTQLEATAVGITHLKFARSGNNYSFFKSTDNQLTWVLLKVIDIPVASADAIFKIQSNSAAMQNGIELK